jgi:hypothetical protein
MSPIRLAGLKIMALLLSGSLACSLLPTAATSSATPAAAVSDTPSAATAPAATLAPTASPTVQHLVEPGDPPEAPLFLIDVDSSRFASEHRATGGDNFSRNRFERPFTANEMDYRPDLDIVYAGVSAEGDWLYFAIQVEGSEGPPTGHYGTFAVEIDLDLDGRGDWWIAVREPESETWSTEGVVALTDANGDVGGDSPLDSDPSPAQGDGYEDLVFDQGSGEDPDAAWARVLYAEQPVIYIAVHRPLLAGDGSFLWGAWADDGVNNPAFLDYSDHFSAHEAGSPIQADAEYPVKALAAVDNTCRMYFGFSPSGSEPGICVVTGTVQNCTPHPMMMQPGNRLIPGFFDPGSIVEQVSPGTYSFYDQNVAGYPVVLTVSLSPGGTIQVKTDGDGNSYPCP